MVAAIARLLVAANAAGALVRVALGLLGIIAGVVLRIRSVRVVTA